MFKTINYLWLTCWITIIPSFLFAQRDLNADIKRKETLRRIFSKAKLHSLYKGQVDWGALEQKISINAERELSGLEFEQRVKLIFQELGDRHATLLFKGKRIIHGNTEPVKIRPSLTDPIRKGKATLRTYILEKGYGYILIPPGGKWDANTLQRMQDSLCALDLRNLKGLIIDLRLHEGGSIYPLASLSQLYGSKVIGYNANIHGQIQNPWKVYNGKYYQGVQMVASVKLKCRTNDQIKIAILTSQLTASAGEVMAVAFKGRKNTIFIGEDTFGLTTINSEFDLGDGYYLALSSAFLADRNGKTYNKFISPDIKITEGDNFENIGQDQKVDAALRWLREL